MKVKISYTTSMEDIPYECNRLLYDKVNDGLSFNEHYNKIKNNLSDNNIDPILILGQIHQLRLVLSSYDTTLNDIYSILSSWSQHRLQNFEKHDIVQNEQQERDE